MKVGCGVSVGLALCCLASVASAEPASLRDFLFGSRRSADDALPMVAKYQSGRGEDFVLDRSGGRRAVLKFDDNPEIWALIASPGPRGDVIYRNDMGRAVLRATRLGGLTLFTPDVPEGAAAASLGAASAPKPLQVFGPDPLFNILLQAGARSSRAAQHLIIFDAGDADVKPGAEPVFADAFLVTADAIVQVSTHGSAGHAACARVAKVYFVQGSDAAAQMVGRIVRITIAPDLGVAGRPSSQRIAAAIWAR